MSRRARLLLACALAVLAASALLAASRPPSRAADTASPLSQPLRRLTHDGRSTPVTWTPDGGSLLVKRPGQVRPGQLLSELWAISQDGSARRLSENASLAAIHGTQAAYVRYLERGRWELVLSDLAGNVLQSLGAAGWTLPPSWVGEELFYADHSGQLRSFHDLSVSWLPDLDTFGYPRVRLSSDGQYLALSGDGALRILGSQGQAVVARAEQIWGFSWSPVAAQLAYVTTNGGPRPELWVWDAATDRSWLLLHRELAYLDTPVWSPDGQRLAFTLYATGSGPNAGGDIWLVGADGADPHPLARTPADERAPRWSPDGERLAFSLNGDLWIAILAAPDLGAALAQAALDAESTSLPSIAGGANGQAATLSASPPDPIRVIHDDVGNTCRNVPDGQIDEYAFEDYVRRVVPVEVPPSWPSEALKTQAVAARTYAWRKAIDRRQDPAGDPGYDVWDSTRDQHMCDSPHVLTDLAVAATEDQYVSYNGDVIYAFFGAEAGSPTNYKQELNLQAAPYLRPVDDPVGFAQVRNGHSWGMSQWGAYRWAAWHGWDYQQILSHYYSFATIEPAGGAAPPLVGLSLPWPNHFTRTDRAYLQANAVDDDGVIAVAFSARLADAWTTIYTDTQASDGWSYVWPVGAIADTVTPSIALRATAYDSTGLAAESEISLVGLHRTPPTGTLNIPSTTVHSLDVTFDLSAADPEPVSGTLVVGLGNHTWVWEDTAFHFLGGVIEADSLAKDGSAWHASPGTNGVLFGPYTTILPAGRQYRAWFRVRAPSAAIISAQELAKLDVAVDGGETLLGIHYLRGTDFVDGSAYQEFAVDFDYPIDGGELEFRAANADLYDLWVDRVRITSYPIDVPAQMAWTLPAYEGVVTVTCKFVDAAGNVSGDVPLAITVVDDRPPADWRQLQCNGATCTVQVRDEIAGLGVNSARYRVSSTGGISWSDWQPATCSGEDGSRGWEVIESGTIPLGAGPDGTLLQFSVQDVAAAPNVGESPVYRIWPVYLPLVTRHNQ